MKQELSKNQKLILDNFYAFIMFMSVSRNNRVLIPNSRLYKELAFAFQRNDKNLMILLPRKHCKTLITSLYTLYYIMKYPDNSVLVVCDTRDKAKSFLSGIKKLMTFNDNFIQVFGNKLLSRENNDRYSLRLKRRQTTAKENNIQVSSIEQGVQSIRADLIIFEDIVNKSFIRSRSEREKVFESWYHAEPLLETMGKRVVTGTRYTNDDLYQYIIDLNDENNEWSIFNEGVYSNVYEDSGVLCSYVMSPEEVERKKRELPRDFFAAQYQNKPVASTLNNFDVDSYNRYENHDLWKSLPCLYMAVDLSDGIGKDKSSLCICGRDDNGKIYLIDAFGDSNIDAISFYKKIYDYFKLYNFKIKKIFIELNRNGRAILNNTFMPLRSQNNHLDLNFIGITNTETKGIRIEKLEPLLRVDSRGYSTIYLPSDNIIKRKKHLSDLLDEFVFYNPTSPRTNQDDLIDAFSMCVEKLKDFTNTLRAYASTFVKLNYNSRKVF